MFTFFITVPKHADTQLAQHAKLITFYNNYTTRAGTALFNRIATEGHIPDFMSSTRLQLPPQQSFQIDVFSALQQTHATQMA